MTNLENHHYNLFVKAKITSETSIKEWSKNQNNKESSGRLFSVQLLDSTGVIRNTFFEAGSEQFYDLVQVGNIYDMRNASVKSYLRKLNNIDHKFELNAVETTLIDIDGNTPPKSMKLSSIFQDLKSLLNATDENCTNVIAIIKEIHETSEIHSRDEDKTYKRKDINMLDKTNTMISLSLWGDHATNFSGKVGQVIVLKRAVLNLH
ncbi:hypothetical protein QAD02_021698 [Eretmocerus hayati]|uniref:Uncharacterized protein n=1 Tax=Eretmocerus hayati TaxID=131215 RepID=A0ACC2PVS9_9HYME|nr:hypothetical protein QAD02_021698 [Eretmocerus hayati]